MFKKIKATEIKENSIKLFKEGAPICVCGTIDEHNGLTIGWGMLGSLWRKEVAIVYIKPTRYTFEYANQCEYFSIMWFDDELKLSVNRVFGSLSGKDVNKEELANLSLIELDNCPCYQEAKMIITCRKIYQAPLKKENILSNDVLLMPLYNDELFHSEYIGEIVNVYIKE